MSVTRIIEDSCEECIHSEICNIKGNCAALRQQTHDLEKLLENESFQIVVSCNYYQRREPSVRKAESVTPPGGRYA
ncbi:MAG: hypothetical protein NC122_04935 [Faecalibacterium sp.]|nr:hypothetical protein [Ruminococcus sp.]MCM1391894.1 hypothetical protein [Ruminococcus sp.]MCM1485530.1 hypothetical protein [Faecalibacterium sp.]